MNSELVRKSDELVQTMHMLESDVDSADTISVLPKGRDVEVLISTIDYCKKLEGQVKKLSGNFSVLRKMRQIFTKDQIENCMKKYGLSKFESLIYLWAFDNFHVNIDEVRQNYGTAMYIKLAKTIGQVMNGRL